MLNMYILNFRNHCVFFLWPLSKCHRHYLVSKWHPGHFACIRSTKTAKKLRGGYMGDFEGCYYSYFSQEEAFMWCWETLSGYIPVAYTAMFHAPTLAFKLDSCFCTVGCWWSLSAQARSKPLWTNQERMWNTHSWKNISISGSKPRSGCIFVSGPKNMARFLRSDVDYSWYCFTSWRKICQECCKYLFCVGYGVAAVPQASITVSGDWTQNCNWPSQIDWEWEVWLFFCNKFCLWYVHVML